MPLKQLPSPTFALEVRSALAHLYDYAYLQTLPLAEKLGVEARLDQVTRAQRVRRAVLDAVEALRPQGQGDTPTRAARAYAILIGHYVDGLPIEELARKLALSRRQAYREHEKGIEAVTSILWERLRQGDAARQAEAPPESSVQHRLTVAQAEVQRLEQVAHTDTLHLEEILQDVLGLLGPRMQQAEVDLRAVRDDPWPPVAADRVMLRQALLNLLSYAVDASPRRDLVILAKAGRGQLTVEIEAVGKAKAGAELSPPTDEPAVGLAVAQALIEAQGGFLEIAVATGSWRASMSLPTVGRAVILAIDDNADIVSLLRRYLAGHDVSIVSATDEEQALQRAADLRPDLITLDVMMPGRDGWEILQRLKGSPATKDIPVVICSVLNEPQLAQSMGASAYLTKPISQVALLEVLRDWLGRLRPVA